MAIYHLHVRNISRGDGRSVVAAAAYRAGETLPNEAEERESTFGGRRDVLHAEIRLPAGAPAWMADRARLWNAAEAAEKRKDARLAKEIEFALPRELPRAEWLRIARTMADAYTSKGHVADFAIHDDGTAHNPHVHILLTTRVVTSDGFGGKMREADGVKFVTEARALWAQTANIALKHGGADARIDARSHKAAGEERAPGRHRGVDATARRQRRARMDRDRLDEARDELELIAVLEEMYANRHDPGPPVPDPEGNLISPAEQDRAERAMLADIEGPAENYPEPPRPEQLTEAERAAAADWWQHVPMRGEERAPEHVAKGDDADWWRDTGAALRDPSREDDRDDRGR